MTFVELFLSTSLDCNSALFMHLSIYAFIDFSVKKKTTNLSFYVRMRVNYKHKYQNSILL